MFAAAILSQAVVTDSAFAQQPQNYTPTVTAQEMIQIMNALSAQPYKDVYVLINKLSQQINSQNQPPKADPPKEDQPK